VSLLSFAKKKKKTKGTAHAPAIGYTQGGAAAAHLGALLAGAINGKENGLFRLAMKICWVSHRICRKDVGRVF
jgi:hypothetical protein